MNATQIRQTLATAFEISTVENADIIEACYKICVDYNFKPDDLLFEWQALNFNANQTVRGLERSLTSITLDGAKELRNHLAKMISQKNEQRKSMRGRGRGRALNFNTGTRVNSSTAVPAAQPAAAPLATSRKTRLQNASPSVQFNGPGEKETNQRAYRYMFEKISVRSEGNALLRNYWHGPVIDDFSKVLDDRIDEFAQLLKETYGIEEFEDPSALTDGVMTVIGRICVDAEVDPSSSKLSPTTLMLEASRIIGSGKRVPLRFTSDFCIKNGGSNKSLFPGEIVAFRGKNGGGGMFLVEEILSVPAITPQRKSIPRPLEVYVTSGPYTSEQSLDFTPFTSIINEAKASHPSTLILLGPFIDSAHPSVKAGKLPASPSQLFQQYFMEPITSLLIHHSDMLIILIPHVRDILCGHAVYPQSASEADFGPLPCSSIKILPNPCVFSLNRVVFGASSADVLHHLKNQQYIQRSEQQQQHSSTSSDTTTPTPSLPDAMANLCEHVLEQRSFYPVFPVPLELSSDINLDMSHSDFLKVEEPGPDVFLLPSRLRQFSKTVGNVTVINPSIFGKSNNMAQIQIPAMADEGHVKEVIHVELKRLS